MRVGEAVRRHLNATGSPRRGIVWVGTQGVAIYSCYTSPNASLDDFQEWLDVLAASVRGAGGQVIVGGDFNAKLLSWGDRREDARGRMVLETPWALGIFFLM